MENIIRRIIITLAISLLLIMVMSLAVFATIDAITDFKGTATDSTISLSWTKSSSADNTTIQYSTTTFPSNNLLTNSNFEIGDPPDDWNLGARSTISAESTIKKIGGQSLKIVTNDAGGTGVSYAIQNYSGYVSLAGETVTLGAWVYAPSTNDKTQKINISDGVDNGYSSAIPKDDSWHWVTTTLNIDSTPTRLWSMFMSKSEATADTDDILYVDYAVLLVGDEPTTAYSGNLSYYTITGLTSGNSYYLSAWGYNGTDYSATAADILITTQPIVTGNETIPYSTPIIPTEAWQEPDTSGWSAYPLGIIVEWFSDPSYEHGGLGMPTNNLIMFIVGIIIMAIGIWTYIKWRTFFASFVIIFIFSFFAVSAHVMQGYIIGLEILIGGGVWAVEKNFQ